MVYRVSEIYFFRDWYDFSLLPEWWHIDHSAKYQQGLGIYWLWFSVELERVR